MIESWLVLADANVPNDKINTSASIREIGICFIFHLQEVKSPLYWRNYCLYRRLQSATHIAVLIVAIKVRSKVNAGISINVRLI